MASGDTMAEQTSRARPRGLVVVCVLAGLAACAGLVQLYFLMRYTRTLPPEAWEIMGRAGLLFTVFLMLARSAFLAAAAYFMAVRGVSAINLGIGAFLFLWPGYALTQWLGALLIEGRRLSFFSGGWLMLLDIIVALGPVAYLMFLKGSRARAVETARLAFD